MSRGMMLVFDSLLHRNPLVLHGFLTRLALLLEILIAESFHMTSSEYSFQQSYIPWPENLTVTIAW
jgi:hypothetical protein